MYINFHKFNYSTVPSSEQARYEQRDKEAYKEVLTEWLNSNIDSFVDRKWEIEEIYYLKNINDFIKLVREAESLYELGFFTGCTALIGVSAEDFSKYLSINAGRLDHITGTYTGGKRNGQSYDISQCQRLKFQLSDGIINQSTYDLLDEIRTIRNDCLHYNQAFKQKSVEQLKVDALKILNNLKSVLRQNIGTHIDPEDMDVLMDELFKGENHRNFEELVWKQKNMLSHLFQISTVQDPDVKQVIKRNLFKVTELDDEEIELTELEVNPESGINLLVYVDIDATGNQLIQENNLVIDDFVFAEVYSNVAKDGQTQQWYLRRLQKLQS